MEKVCVWVGGNKGIVELLIEKKNNRGNTLRFKRECTRTEGRPGANKLFSVYHAE